MTRATACPVCGSEVLPERRMPGRSRVARHAERRQTDEIAAIRLEQPPPAATV